MKTIFFTCLLVFVPPLDACYAIYESDYVSGLNRVCFYDHLGSTYTITVDSVELCPQTTYVYH